MEPAIKGISVKGLLLKGKMLGSYLGVFWASGFPMGPWHGPSEAVPCGLSKPLETGNPIRPLREYEWLLGLTRP